MTRADAPGVLAVLEQTNVTLHTLQVAENSVGDVGAEALANALLTNATVRTLILRGNRVHDAGAEALADALVPLGLRRYSGRGALPPPQGPAVQSAWNPRCFAPR